MAVIPYNQSKRSATLEPSNVIKAAPCNLVSLIAQLDPTAGTTARCVMIFDATSLPSNGTAPAWSFPCEGGKAAAYDFGLEPLYLGTGCTVAFSSTYDTLTVVVANEGTFAAQFD